VKILAFGKERMSERIFFRQDRNSKADVVLCAAALACVMFCPILIVLATCCESFGQQDESQTKAAVLSVNGVKPVGAAFKKILYLNSYHPGYSWGDGVAKGLREALSASPMAIDISEEYLDSRRFPEESHFETMMRLIKRKYASYRFDVVVVSDNAAFSFAVKYRQELFPDVPLVFCGFNNFRSEFIEGVSNITGVNEEIDINAGVQTALTVHPNASTLVFIVSTGDASNRRIAEEFNKTMLPRLARQYAVEVLEDASMKRIREHLAGLPENSLVFLSGQTKDQGDGRALSPEENGRLISSASRFPVYTFWDLHMKTGVLGGQIIIGEEQGRAAGELALRVLAGESASSIPVVMTTPTTNVFEYGQMQHFGISESRLPPGSVVLNKPTSLWHQYRGYIMGTLALVLLEAVLITILITAMRQRRHALIALRDERDQLDKNVAERTSELSKANAKLQLLSEQDGLTGVANRRKFEAVWDVEWNRALRQGCSLAVALVDVDLFKAYNDHYGHLLGDECLKRVAVALASSARRAGELTARYGGEEFVVVLPGLSQDEAAQAVQRMRKAVEAQNIPHAASDVAPVVTISIGLAARVPVDGETPDSLLRDADDCLYQAKHHGRNQVVAAWQAVSTMAT
jgi:diguanylate cyclase (GGDEF)-like protein